ncbi:hypothetical protein Tco_1181297 [Tanacetum coccineum]
MDKFVNLLFLFSHRACSNVQLVVLCSAFGDLFKATLAMLLHPGSYNSLYANEEEKEFNNVRHQKVIVNKDSKIASVWEIVKHMVDTSYGLVGQVVVFVNDVTEPNLLHNHLRKWRVKTPKLAPENLKDECLGNFRAWVVVTLLDEESDFHLLENDLEHHFNFEASQVDTYAVNMNV